ncbi:MAG: GSCFA domain-containing protein [Bacteroidota bacterium]
MNSFRTIFPGMASPFQIGHHDRILLSGSCFTEHIGSRLNDLRFRTLVNPFGIVYNPFSIADALARLSDGNAIYTRDSIFENQGVWRSWDHHSQFAKPDPVETLNGMNDAFRESSLFLKDTTYLLITLGTADVFYLHETGKIVANNHKMPDRLFGTRRLSVDFVADVLTGCLGSLLEKNPGMRFILTVSPVRHLRKGMIENQRSKAVLCLACEAVCRQIPEAHYFPAYEILLDDLRDYRFYTSDMIHPSDVAVNYIWDYFSGTYFSESTRQTNAALEKINAALRHRPFNQDTEQYRAFLAAQEDALRRLGF